MDDKKKRKEKIHHHLTVTEKQQVLSLIDQKVSYREIVSKFKISTSAITGIKNKRNEIASHQENDLNPKFKRICLDSDINQRVYEWYCNKRARGFCVTCPML